MALKHLVEAREKRELAARQAKLAEHQKEGNRVSYRHPKTGKYVWTTEVRHAQPTSDGKNVAISFSNGDKLIFPKGYVFGD